jgi:hypothetical protein
MKNPLDEQLSKDIIFWSSYCRDDKVREVLANYYAQFYISEK